MKKLKFQQSIKINNICKYKQKKNKNLNTAINILKIKYN